MADQGSFDTTSTVAELHVIADLIERQRDRVGGLAEPYLGSDRQDAIAALHEAERQLLMSSRALRRAIKSIG